ncbi:MAG: hypothetical protein FWH33_00300 [Oscillospiraceae bacterium]|nr:hypothetical protein [Oscillospiraceae bacterium]
MIGKLIKLNIIALFSGILKTNRKRTKPVAKALIILLLVYACGVLLVSFGAVFLTMAEPLFSTGIGWFYFALMGIIIFVLCFIGSVFMVQPQIFEARDSELLLSLPLKPSMILAGRIFALLVVDYAFEALIVIPAFAALIISGCISYIPMLGMVFLIAAAVLLPLVALAAGCFFGWLVASIASRLRRKNIVTLVFSIALFAVCGWGYYGVLGNMNSLLTSGAEIAEAVRRAVFPAYHLGVAISGGSIMSFLIFAACAVVPYALMHMLLSASFMKLAMRGRGAKKVKYREKAMHVSGVGAALLGREMRLFMSLPLYIINSGLGAIVTVAIAVVLVVRPQLLTDPIVQLSAFMPSFETGFIGAIVLSALAVMNSVSSPSISLEGKSLWIVKSLPVRERDVLLSKVMLHVVVCGAPSIVAGVICIFALHLRGVAEIALTLVMPVSVTVLFALLGVTLNLAMPKFDWINPIQPVKQSASTMLVIFGGMALVVVLAAVYGFLLSSALSLGVYLVLCTVVFVAACAGLYAHLISAGCRRFQEL